MLKQIYLSDALPYRLPWAGIPSGIGLYSGYLVTPPRVYAETLDQMVGIATFADVTATSGSTIKVIALNQQIYWPSWDFRVWSFDGTTGKFIENIPLGGGGINYYYQVFQSTDGSLWQVSVIGKFRELEKVGMTLVDGSERNATDFGYTTIVAVIVDRERDLAVISGDSNRTITVHKFSTGDLLRTIYLGGFCASIAGEDFTRCFVLTTNGILHLIDFSSGVVINTVRLAADGAGLIAWDRLYRRLLWFDKQPDAIDGAGSSVIRGFYPVPLATYLTAPIPLTPPRNKRPVNVLIRAVGDIGEPVSGVNLTCTVTGDASVAVAAPGTDGNGDAVLQLTPSAEGSINIEISTVVNDGL